ncbi:MAG: glycoside hydrolase domain-containing protein [Gemmatimonadaceae bacterium]
MIKRRNILALLLAGGLVSCGETPGIRDVSPSSAVDMLAGVVENVASAVTGKGHLGFDTGIYPGDETMRVWRATAPYKWVGYYLPAPCHKDDSWAGKRAQLTDMGWGLAVIYVGQQTWSGVPAKHSTVYRTTYKTKTVTKYVSKRVKTYVKKNGKRVPKYVTKRVPTRVKQRVPVRTPVRVAFEESKHGLMSCQRNLVTQSRGALEAADAIAKTAGEGFPRGTVIFLDIERMDVTPKAMRDYYKEWVARVLADGRFVPGIYAHTHNASLIYRDVKAVYAGAGRTEEPPFWIAGGRNFAPTKAPKEIGHAFAAVWQGVLDVVQEWNGHKVKIDVNVAETPSPSLHRVEAD